MRLFVAVAVPEQVAGELEAAVAPLRSSWPSLRWTGIDAWHLTLAFLGELNDVVAAGLADPLRIAAAEHARLALSLAGSGAFPGAARAHVLWTGVHGDLERLDDLAGSVAEAAKNEGAPPGEEGRVFQPHLTLARSRAAVDVRGNLPDSEPPRLAATLRDAGQLAARRDDAPGRGACRAAADVGCVL